MSLYEDTQPTESLNRVWRAVVHKAPTDISDTLDVVIPGFDNTIVFEDCKWQSRDSTSLPGADDPCLVIFDSDREPWVVAWWPF